METKLHVFFCCIVRYVRVSWSVSACVNNVVQLNEMSLHRHGRRKEGKNFEMSYFPITVLLEKYFSLSFELVK